MSKALRQCNSCGNPALRLCTHTGGRTVTLCPECRYAVHLAALLRGDPSVQRTDLEIDKADLARQAEP